MPRVAKFKEVTVAEAVAKIREHIAKLSPPEPLDVYRCRK